MNNQATIDRRAQALAEVAQMEKDLHEAHNEVATLRRDLDRTNDRVDLLTEERTRYRTEATLYRSKLIELATSMANIGLLTIQAQEIMHTVKDIAAQETPEEAQAERASAALMVQNLPNPIG